MAPPKNRIRKFHRRSKNGCSTCKLRHVRCDERKPLWYASLPRLPRPCPLDNAHAPQLPLATCPVHREPTDRTLLPSNGCLTSALAQTVCRAARTAYILTLNLTRRLNHILFQDPDLGPSQPLSRLKKPPSLPMSCQTSHLPASHATTRCRQRRNGSGTNVSRLLCFRGHLTDIMPSHRLLCQRPDSGRKGTEPMQVWLRFLFQHITRVNIRKRTKDTSASGPASRLSRRCGLPMGMGHWIP